MVIVKKTTTNIKGEKFFYAFCTDCKLVMSVRDINAHKCRYETK